MSPGTYVDEQPKSFLGEDDPISSPQSSVKRDSEWPNREMGQITGLLPMDHGLGTRLQPEEDWGEQAEGLVQTGEERLSVQQTPREGPGSRDDMEASGQIWLVAAHSAGPEALSSSC